MIQWLRPASTVADLVDILQTLSTGLKAVLRLNGDVLCPEDRGPVIRSPNGNYWRIEVDNAGALSATDVTSEYTS